MMLIKDFLEDPARKFPCGYYVVECPNLMLYLSQTSIIFLDLNVVVLSVIILLGQPK